MILSEDVSGGQNMSISEIIVAPNFECSLLCNANFGAHANKKLIPRHARRRAETNNHKHKSWKECGSRARTLNHATSDATTCVTSTMLPNVGRLPGKMTANRDEGPTMLHTISQKEYVATVQLGRDIVPGEEDPQAIR